ncbi:MAG: TonB-dependent receptor [Dysgonamonadaceae bacterium]|nr:TonB-dependent receptor [Dysgonamonadaceae bacterium]
MNKKSTIVIFSLFFCISLSAQNHTINGYIRDAESKEMLIGANVFETESRTGSHTNAEGFYTISLPKGKRNIIFSYLGYESMAMEFDLQKDTTIHIYLNPAVNELSEVIVSHHIQLREMQLGVVNMPVSTIRATPALLGETDLMKTLQLIPGVQSTSEGKSDLSVRGGSPDQNLILFDGVPVYNPNHVFGFLSVFNTDALKDVMLYKSSFPARFGGRLSSVIDISTKDGNKQRFSGSASIGLPVMKFNLEGPIIKDRTSFTFSARRSYVDLFMGTINDWFVDENSSSTANFFFHDINAKIHHKVDDKTSLSLSVYNGYDKLMQETSDIGNAATGHSASSGNLDWGTTIINGQLRRMLAPNLSMRTMLTYNRYHYKVNTEDEFTTGNDWQTKEKAFRNFLFSSGIQDYSAAADFEYFPLPNHTIRFGTTYTFHHFKPEVVSISIQTDETKTSENTPKHTYANNWALYAEDDWRISNRMNLNAGLRFSLFNVDNKTYTGLDPRLSLRYLLTEKMALQTSYTMMQQYVHLLSSNSIILQTDLWVPVTGNVKPMRSHQYSFGMFYELPKSFLFSVESYYKDMRNVIEYKDGISYTGVSAGWEHSVEAGIGRSYGIEFSLEKRAGRTTGIAAYTWSKSERKFDEINYGEWFPSKFDRRHVINLSLNYQINKNFDIATAWTYHSGDRITLAMMSHVGHPMPDDWNFIDGLLELEHRNNFQMAPYHRLDIGINYTFARRNNRFCVLNLSAYNAYNRMNPYRVIVSADSKEDYTYTYRLKQITLFPIIPGLSFTYHF